MLSDDEAWGAVMRRDRRHDGRFVTGVLTTGIYCRPSCAARHPKRENVRFFADGAAARGAGLRACRRCHPDEVAPDEAAIARVRAMIEAADRAPTLDSLARATGYSPFHLQRLFKRAVGMSPAAYARSLRGAKMRDALQQEDSVTGAIYAAGYEAPSRFYEDARRLGMTPSAWKDGGRGVTIRYARRESPLGPVMVAATDRGICSLNFDEEVADLSRRFPNADLIADDGAFADLIDRAFAAVEAPLAAADLPLDVAGTAFQERVWAELKRIPPGETRSYADIAAALGQPTATRAVGTANGQNPVAVLVPCHRVIRSDGSLGGYAGGLERKVKLLEAEGSLPTLL